MKPKEPYAHQTIRRLLLYPYAFDEDKEQAFDSGTNAHAAKPFDINVLMEILDGILNEKDGGSAP